MQPNEIIRAVLESRGWTYHPFCPSNVYSDTKEHWTRKGLVGEDLIFTPPLLTSLDACHEVFEKDAPDGYWQTLCETVNKNKETDTDAQIAVRTFIATPPQRCEAWLTFKGLWKD